MEGILVLVPGAVLTLVYLAQPLLRKNLDTPWDQIDILRSEGDSTEESSTRATAPDQESRRAMTDGGRVCHNCGTYVDGDYLYCAECLMPRV